jgi:hypothetical protein
MLPECQLFGTLGCHLCEVAEAELMPFVEHGLLVELVDIAEDESWLRLTACGFLYCAEWILAQS